jgi:hypothetical protein
VCATIELPLLKSAKYVLLDASEFSIKLEDSKGFYNLAIELDSPIHDEQTTAKFDKAARTLKITAPLRKVKKIAKEVALDPVETAAETDTAAAESPTPAAAAPSNNIPGIPTEMVHVTQHPEMEMEMDTGKAAPASAPTPAAPAAPEPAVQKAALSEVVGPKPTLTAAEDAPNEDMRLKCVEKMAACQPCFNECHVCGKGAKKLSKCSMCKAVQYCSQDCQKAGWKAHKSVCPVLKGVKLCSEAGRELPHLCAKKAVRQGSVVFREQPMLLVRPFAFVDKLPKLRGICKKVNGSAPPQHAPLQAHHLLPVLEFAAAESLVQRKVLRLFDQNRMGAGSAASGKDAEWLQRTTDAVRRAVRMMVAKKLLSANGSGAAEEVNGNGDAEQERAWKWEEQCVRAALVSIGTSFGHRGWRKTKRKPQSAEVIKAAASNKKGKKAKAAMAAALAAEEDVDAESASMLFEWAPLLRHSSMPNCTVRFDSTAKGCSESAGSGVAGAAGVAATAAGSGSTATGGPWMVLTALVDLQPDTPLTISLIDPFDLRIRPLPPPPADSDDGECDDSGSSSSCQWECIVATLDDDDNDDALLLPVREQQRRLMTGRLLASSTGSPHDCSRGFRCPICTTGTLFLTSACEDKCDNHSKCGISLEGIANLYARVSSLENGAVYTFDDGTKERVKVVKSHSEGDGGGYTVFIESLGRERSTVAGRLDFDETPSPDDAAAAASVRVFIQILNATVRTIQTIQSEEATSTPATPLPTPTEPPTEPTNPSSVFAAAAAGAAADKAAAKAAEEAAAIAAEVTADGAPAEGEREIDVADAQRDLLEITVSMPLPRGTIEFEAKKKFAGARLGCVYKDGAQGVGYYFDRMGAAIGVRARAIAKAEEEEGSDGAGLRLKLEKVEAWAAAEARALWTEYRSGRMLKIDGGAAGTTAAGTNGAVASSGVVGRLVEALRKCEVFMGAASNADTPVDEGHSGCHWVLRSLLTLTAEMLKIDFQFAAAAIRADRAIQMIEAITARQPKSAAPSGADEWTSGRQCVFTDALIHHYELLGDTIYGAIGGNPQVFLGKSALALRAQLFAIEKRLMPRRPPHVDEEEQRRAKEWSRNDAIEAYQRALQMLHTLYNGIDGDKHLHPKGAEHISLIKGKLGAVVSREIGD